MPPRRANELAKPNAVALISVGYTSLVYVYVSRNAPLMQALKRKEKLVGCLQTFSKERVNG